jgi:YegS/Rv2252/BmrU family lipid kinase
MKDDLLASKKKKTFVVFNPVAGQTERDSVEQQIRSVLSSHQIPHHIHETVQGEDLHTRVQLALKQDFEQFLAVGGDGTVSGVASGLVGTQIPVVIIPTGTANALAKVLKIPSAPEQIFDWWITADHVKKIDAMQVDDHSYFLNISVGMSSKALADVKRQDKRKFGSLAYLLRGFQRLIGFSRHKFRLHIDDWILECRASDLIVANSGIIQFKPLRLNPEIEMDDAKLSICYIRADTILDYLKVAAGILFGHPTKTQQLTCRDALRVIRIQTNQQLPVQADGELIGRTPVTIQLIPAAVHIVVPGRD